MFKPITTKLDVVNLPVSTPKVAPKKSLEAIDYYPYEEMDIEGLIDNEEEVFPEQDKQIPEDSPPAYSPGKYMKLKQQRALEEKEIFEKYGLPIIETTEETTEEAPEAYDSVVKELEKKGRLTFFIKGLKDPSEIKNLEKQRDLLQRESFTITERRNKLKKIGKGFVRKRGGNLLFFNDPKNLLKKLELIIGEILAGNTNIEMYNTGVAILDVLLKSSLINKSQHEKIFKKHFQ